MTFRQLMLNLLTENGMSSNVAETVLIKSISDDCNESMRSRWDEDVLSYPDSIKNILWASTKAIALDWIKKNQPQAWYKPMFEE